MCNTQSIVIRACQYSLRMHTYFLLIANFLVMLEVMVSPIHIFESKLINGKYTSNKNEQILLYMCMQARYASSEETLPAKETLGP